MQNDGRGPGAKNRQAKRERQAEWNKAIREGRAVRIICGKDITHRSYTTASAARVVVDTINAEGDCEANIVPPESAQ